MTSNISYTLRNKICTGCGICEGVCPSKAIRMNVIDGMFKPVVEESLCKNSKGCHLCYDACAGLGVDLVGLSHKLFEDKDIQTNKYAGTYISAYVGYSCDEHIRYHSASGGMVTQFLIWLLEKKIIDGAVVTRFNANASLKVETFIATTKADMVSAKSSKYSPVTMNRVIEDIKSASGSKYVVVGLPCHIHSLQKLLQFDKALRSKIFGLFSLFCSSSRTFYYTEYLMRERKIDLNSLSYLSYRERGCLGGLVAKGKDITGKEIDFYEDYMKYSHPLRSIFVPRRCLLCVDHYGELADISFGDIYVPPYSQDKKGVNSVIVRSSEWNQLLMNAAEDGYIKLYSESIDKINESQPSAYMKKERNTGFIAFNKIFGRVVPDYGNMVAKGVSINVIVKYAHNRIQQFIGGHKWLWWLIPILKAKV